MSFEELMEKIARAGGLVTIDTLGFVTIHIDLHKLAGAFDGDDE